MILLFLLGITTIVFFPILNNDFILEWDDKWMIMNPYTEGGINMLNIHGIFSSYYYGQYSPINQLFYLFIYNIAEYNPLPYHLYSLILHLLNIIGVYYFLYQFLSLLNKANKKTIHIFSCLVTLIFALHPLQVESVAWISASKVLLFSFFYLYGLNTWLLFLRKKEVKYAILCIFLFCCSCMSKEQAVTFPLCLILINYFLSIPLKKGNRKEWLLILPFFFIALCFGINIIVAQSGSTRIEELLVLQSGYPLWQRVILGSYSLVEYIFKFLFPYKLMYLYPFPSLQGLPLPNWLLFYPLLLTTILICFWHKLKQRYLLFGIFFFLINIGITLHIIPISRFAIVADRYIYIPIIGLSFIIGYIFLHCKEKSTKRWHKITLFFICALYISTLGIRSHTRSQDWKDSSTIKQEIRELLNTEK